MYTYEHDCHMQKKSVTLFSIYPLYLGCWEQFCFGEWDYMNWYEQPVGRTFARKDKSIYKAWKHDFISNIIEPYITYIYKYIKFGVDRIEKMTIFFLRRMTNSQYSQDDP